MGLEQHPTSAQLQQKTMPGMPRAAEAEPLVRPPVAVAGPRTPCAPRALLRARLANPPDLQCRSCHLSMSSSRRSRRCLVPAGCQAGQQTVEQTTSHARRTMRNSNAVQPVKKGAPQSATAPPPSPAGAAWSGRRPPRIGCLVMRREQLVACSLIVAHGAPCSAGTACLPTRNVYSSPPVTAKPILLPPLHSLPAAPTWDGQ